jgi:hypothetical protein
VAERLAERLRGKIKLEDAGFDWKVRRHEGGREWGKMQREEAESINRLGK